MGFGWWDKPNHFYPALVLFCMGNHPVVLFDGVCNLCSGSVKWIIRRDPDAVYRFAPLQSDVGREHLLECGLPTDDVETFVLVEDDECYTKSTAALRIAVGLGGIYLVLYPFLYVPRFLRDAVYDFVANHRYDWFGRKDECMVPTPELRDRFLEYEPPD